MGSVAFQADLILRVNNYGLITHFVLIWLQIHTKLINTNVSMHDMTDKLWVCQDTKANNFQAAAIGY